MKFKKLVLVILGFILILAFAGYIYANYFGGKMPTGTALLSWNASEDSTVAGYKIYYGMRQRSGDCPNGGYDQIIDAKKATEYKLENLKIGQKYYFSVTSYNQSGQESCFSDEISKTIGFPWPSWLKNGK